MSVTSQLWFPQLKKDFEKTGEGSEHYLSSGKHDSQFSVLSRSILMEDQCENCSAWGTEGFLLSSKKHNKVQWMKAGSKNTPKVTGLEFINVYLWIPHQ